jgi:hypothetical protein
VIERADGRLAGIAADLSGFWMLGVSANGQSVDPSFAGPAGVGPSVSGSASPAALRVGAGDKFIVGGRFSGRNGLLRLDGSGRVDATFAATTIGGFVADLVPVLDQRWLTVGSGGVARFWE